MTEQELQRLREISDWNLDVTEIGKSAIFPGPARLALQSEAWLPLFAEELAEEVKKQHELQFHGERKTFGVKCRGVRYRVQPFEQPFYQLRTLHDAPRALGDLKFPQAYIDALMDPELRNRGGLVLVCGPTGSGKTTTVSSVFSARLDKYGGFGLTLEDVIEYLIDGWHGDDGLCRQIQVRSDYRMEMIGALRAFPSSDRSMVLFGEIRDDIAAAELLRTALDGHLVFTTMHGGGIVETLNRLIMIAKREMDVAEARFLLSRSLRLVIHQILQHRTPQVSMLNLLLENAAPAVNAIGDAEVRLDSVLESIIEAQNLNI